MPRRRRAGVGRAAGVPPAHGRHLLGEPLLLPSVATWWWASRPPSAMPGAVDRPVIKLLDRRPPRTPCSATTSAGRAQRAAPPRATICSATSPRNLSTCRRHRCWSASPTSGEPPRTLWRAPSACACSPSPPRRATRHARRADTCRRQRRCARRGHAARRPLEGYLGAQRRAGESPCSRCALQYRQAGRPRQCRANVTSRAAENLFWFGRYGERCDATVRPLRWPSPPCSAMPMPATMKSVPVLAPVRRQGLLETLDNPGTEPRRAATIPTAAWPSSSSGWPGSRSTCATHVGRQPAHAQPADRRPDPAPRRDAAAGARLARPRGDLADDGIGLRARRHDAQHRLALPVDGPPAPNGWRRCGPRSKWRSAAGATAASTGRSNSPTRR